MNLKHKKNKLKKKIELYNFNLSLYIKTRTKINKTKTLPYRLFLTETPLQKQPVGECFGFIDFCAGFNV